MSGSDKVYIACSSYTSTLIRNQKKQQLFVCRLLKDKRALDESFNRFLEMKRGAAMHTLESLMLLPVSIM